MSGANKAIPEYLSEDTFNNLLLQTFERPAQIRSLQVIPQKSFGNYCSDIYRVTLKYEINDSSVDKSDNDKAGEVAQRAPANGEQRVLHVLVKDLFENLSTISNEKFMYAQVLPEINKTLRSCGLQPISPMVYYTLKTAGETHFFEDLTPRGYVIRPRTIGYDEDETRLLFKRLGEYHAASLIYTESHPAVQGKMRQFYAVSDPALELCIEDQMYDNIEHVAKIMETWPGYESIIAKMRKHTREVFRSKFLPLFDASQAKLALVLHGDMWIANLLLQYNNNDGKAEDAVFLDYQNSCYGSPAIDIHNLFMTSVQLSVLAHSYDDIIAHYYAAFRSTLLVAKYPVERIPTLRCIVDELHRTDYFNYYLLIFPFAQTMLSDELVKGMNFNKLQDKQRVALNRADIYSNERVLETYKYMLKAFDERGLLG
ncbi:uncharacterized protein LOC118738849 [Rhagoletis pomonella]|uniref:uncharacterized protein LOC118738849 n=1 Tax=Rhagoletis pomonella TaxID=28610 RepID=UPI00177E8146|nr:uncharacterized protein LOC118738849 [Rhagoletis pomonella]